MRVLFALLLVAALPLIAAQTCGFGPFDFSGLKSTQIDFIAQDNPTNPTYNYYLNVCGPIVTQSTCTTLSAQSSTCQVRISDKTSYDTGNWANPVWSYVSAGDPSQGAVLSIQGTNDCWQPTGSIPYQTNIIFSCSDTLGPMTVINPATTCVFNYTLPSPLGCGGGGKGGGGGGISGGWVFIIILSVCIPLYVIVGCIYKNKKLGATGIEMCPNIEFWRDLPALTKEGCQYTWRKLRGLCGGKAAGGEGSYESM